jgi:hypothetical protein
VAVVAVLQVLVLADCYMYQVRQYLLKTFQLLLVLVELVAQLHGAVMDCQYLTEKIQQ